MTEKTLRLKNSKQVAINLRVKMITNGFDNSLFRKLARRIPHTPEFYLKCQAWIDSIKAVP